MVLANLHVKHAGTPYEWVSISWDEYYPYPGEFVLREEDGPFLPVLASPVGYDREGRLLYDINEQGRDPQPWIRDAFRNAKPKTAE